MRQPIIFLAGIILAVFATTPLLIALVGAITGVASVLVSVFWPLQKPLYIDRVNRPKPASRNGHFLGAGVLAILGIGCWWLVMATPLGGYAVFRLFGLYCAGMSAGSALATLLSGRRAREAHNNWIAAMSPSLNPKWKS